MSSSEWLSMEDMFSADSFAIVTHVDYKDEVIDLLESKQFPIYCLEFGPRIDLEGKEKGLFKKIGYHETSDFSKIYTLKSNVKELYNAEPMFFSKKKEDDFEIKCDSCVENFLKVHDLKEEIDDLRYKCRYYERVIENFQNGTSDELIKFGEQQTTGDHKGNNDPGKSRCEQTAPAIAAKEKKTAERWGENLYSCVRLALWSKEQSDKGAHTTKKDRADWLRKNELPRLLDSAERKFCQAMNDQAPGSIR